MNPLFFFGGVHLFADLRWLKSASLLALYGYVILILALLLLIAILRVTLTLRGKREANNFLPTGEDISPFSQRLCRAHANCYESFPIIGGLLLMAVATQQTAVTDGLALYLLGARFGQILTHLISTSINAVTIRFIFFLLQIMIAVYWLYALGWKWLT